MWSANGPRTMRGRLIFYLRGPVCGSSRRNQFLIQTWSRLCWSSWIQTSAGRLYTAWGFLLKRHIRPCNTKIKVRQNGVTYEMAVDCLSRHCLPYAASGCDRRAVAAKTSRLTYGNFASAGGDGLEPDFRTAQLAAGCYQVPGITAA